MPKTLVVIVGIILTILLLGLYFSPQVSAYYFARKALREEPHIDRVPLPLEIREIAAGTGTTIARYGYTFEVPWTGKEKVDEWETFTRIQFGDDRGVLFFDPSKATGTKDMFDDMGKDGGAAAVTLFGEEGGSNYGLARTIAYFRPSEVSLFSSRQQAVRASMLTLLKSLALRPENALFSVETEHVHGFQKGEAGISRTVYLEVYDREDRLLSIWVYASEAAQKPTQQDLNRILTTLKRAANGG